MIHKTMLVLVTMIALVAVTLGTGPSWGENSQAAQASWTPPEDTIVAITGNRRNGFAIIYLDRSHEYLPTITEALTECTEYHVRVRRVRCTAEVRTWYHDLTATRIALRYAGSIRRD